MSYSFPIRRPATVACCLLLLPALCAHAAEPKTTVSPNHAQRIKAGLELFQKQVRPVLIKHCLDCHGGKSLKADFDLSSRKLLLQSGHVEKTADESFLLDLLSHKAEPHMPHKQPKLPTATIAVIAKWIDLGAPYDKPLVAKKGDSTKPAMLVTDKDRQFWSFQPLKQVSVPQVKNEKWCKSPIDRFVLARLEANGLRPNNAAAKRKLIRRAYFDLLGLPPSPADVEAFVNDKNPQAYEKLIERLLNSKHYGERQARHWMDVARFAESHGYEQDYDRPNAYHYRDFLIKAFNQDMPFDQFARWQIAGDELAPDNPLALMATGFLGAGAFPTQLTEAEFESARYDEMDDMLSTTSATFLGLTVGCCRCHDHKFDPFPTRDYYSLLSTFTSTIRSEIDLAISPDDPGKKSKVQVTSEGFPHMKHHADGRGYPHFYKETHFLTRGDVKQKGDVVDQGFLQVLMRDGKQPEYWRLEKPSNWNRTSYRRASFANWMTDTEFGAGHLLARVIVNRVWQHHFGRGIVASPNDFGFQGERPTHPELLDWLAADFIQSGWKLKRLHTLIMTSAVYQQSSQFDEQRAKIDRDNKLHWRRTPQRLEGEAIRDAMLAVSGLLDTTMYGPGTLDSNMKRRSVYFFIKRSKLIPLMMLFDWPEHLVSIGSRSQTTIAPQALMFMNSPQARQAAEALARRIQKDVGNRGLNLGYQLTINRDPTTKELELANQFLKNQEMVYQEKGEKEPEFLSLIDFCQILFSMNEFVYVD